MSKLLWHFASSTLRDGSPLPEAGRRSDWIERIEPCTTGWHASERALDALRYAPGPNVARVRLYGKAIPHGNPIDKFVGQQRETVSGYVDATHVLLAFTRACALDVIDLWDAPDVVRRYLETGDESIRIAANEAAEDADENAETFASGSAAEAARVAAGDARQCWRAADETAWTVIKAIVAIREDAETTRAAQNTRLEAMLNELIGD